MSNLLTVNDGGGILTAKHFADLECRARSRVHELNKEQFSDWICTFAATVGMISCVSLSPAAPVIAAIGIVGSLGSVLYGNGQFLGSKGIERARAEALIKAMDDATEEQWEALCVAADDVELFGRALESGLLELTRGDIKHGDIYRKAAAFVHAAKPGTIEGYKGRTPTALVPPAPEKKKLVPAVNNEEITRICEVCAARISQSPDREWAAKVIDDAAALLAAKNRQAATNKLIYNSRLTEKEFAKEGITKDRLKLIKVWAAEGAKPDAIASVAVPVVAPVAVEPIVPTPQAEILSPVVAPAPEPIAVAPAAVEVEPIEDEQDDGEIEGEEEGPIVRPTVPAIVVVDQPAARPVMMSSNIRKNTGIGTAKELIEAMLKEAYRSTALIGGERSGKTYLAAIFSKRLKVERKTIVTYINLFDANGDSANDWEHADHVITANLNDDRCDVESVLRKVFTRLRQFQKETNTHLYFDEWVATTSRSNAWEKKAAEDIRRANSLSGQGEFLEPEGIGTSAVELMNLMSAVASELSNIGKKQLKAMWLISPALRAGDIYEQGKVMKSLAPAIVIIPPGRAIEWAHPSGIVQEIGFDLARYQVSEVNLAIPKSYTIPNLDCDRAVFIGGQWYSLDGLNDQKPELDKPIQQTIDLNKSLNKDLDESWGDEVDEMVEEAAADNTETETLDEIAAKIMGMTKYSMKARLQMIEDAQRG